MYLRSFSSEAGVYPIPAKAPNELRKRYDWLEREDRENSAAGFEDDFRIVARFAHNRVPAERREYTAHVHCKEVYEYVEFERLGSKAEIFLNGKKIGDTFRTHGRQANNAVRPYRFYSDFAAGDNELRVVALHEESDPPVMSGYVKIGRRTETPWTVRLHAGRARVFVKTASPEAVTLYLLP